MQVHRHEALVRDAMQRPTPERLLQALAECTVLVVRAARWRDVLGAALARFAEAAGMQRASIYRFRTRGGGDPHALAVQAAHWAAAGCEHEGPMEFHQRVGIDPDQPDFRAVVARLAEDQVIELKASRAAPVLAAALARRGVRHAVVAPIRVDAGALWGLCVMGHRDAERSCEAHETRAMLAFGEVVASAVERGRAVQ